MQFLNFLFISHDFQFYGHMSECILFLNFGSSLITFFYQKTFLVFSILANFLWYLFFCIILSTFFYCNPRRYSLVFLSAFFISSYYSSTIFVSAFRGSILRWFLVQSFLSFSMCLDFSLWHLLILICFNNYTFNSGLIDSLLYLSYYISSCLIIYYLVFKKLTLYFLLSPLASYVFLKTSIFFHYIHIGHIQILVTDFVYIIV